MKSVKSVSKTKPNWLLRSFIGISLGIHMVILMHIAGIYRSNALTYIELTMQHVSKPSTRSIPRPRHRPQELQPQDVKRVKVLQQHIPSLKPMKMECIEKNLPDSLVEGISMPDAPATSGLSIADWDPGVEASTDSSLTYLEMVRLRIERHKEYPSTARARQIEGCVTIRFVITHAGDVRALEVVRTSRQKALDTAALRAVKSAAPFPKPPRRLFKGEVPLELTIVFELT